MHHRTTCGASLNSPLIHWCNWSLQAVTLTPPSLQPPPTLPPLSPHHLFSVVGCESLDLWFSSGPTPLGFLYALFVSLSFQIADPAPKTFAARKISLASEYPCFMLGSPKCWKGGGKLGETLLSVAWADGSFGFVFFLDSL